MRIDATGRLSHYLDHLAPVWLALPEEARGTFWVPDGLCDHAEGLGITPTPYGGRGAPPFAGDGPVLVAASQDVRRAPADRPIAYLGHGVGQSFLNRHGVRQRGYTGGAGFESVRLFLAPNERAAALWRDAYPAADVQVVGCPKLGGRSREDGPRGALIVFGFHWRAVIGIPEAGTAWDVYRKHLPDLAGRYRIALHAHPRIAGPVAQFAERHGIEWIPRFDEVLDRAAVYCNDASSTLFEFAAYGGPVVVLNSPRFRRDVHHGLRFWDCADVGPNVWSAGELPGAIDWALADPPNLAARRRAISADLYPPGDAAGRAARAVLSLTAALEVAA